MSTTTPTTTAKAIQRKAPVPAPRPLHLKPKPKPKPTIVPRGSGKVAVSSSSSTSSKVNRVQDLAKKFENTTPSSTSTTSLKPSSSILSTKGIIQANSSSSSNLSKSIISRPSNTSISAVARNQQHRIPSVERRFSKPQTKRFYCRSVTRKRSSLIRQFRSTGDLIAYSNNSNSSPPSTSSASGSVSCGISVADGTEIGRKMIKSKSANEDLSTMITVEKEEDSDGKNEKAKIIGSNNKRPPIPTVPPKKSSNITVVRVSSMSVAGSRPNQAPPKPPPKPSKIMLSKTFRQLRPITPDDETTTPAATATLLSQRTLNEDQRKEEVEPQPSTSSSSHVTAADNEEEKKTSLKSNEEKRKNWIRSKSSIRKPSIRPPPPPVSPKPTGGKATWQQSQIRHSTSASDLYQAMPSPDDPKEAIWGSEVKPTLPSMPPPQPPKPLKNDDEHFDEVYEDIDIGFNPAYRDASPTPLINSLKAVPYSPKYQKRSQQKRNIPFIQNDRESIYHAYASDQGEDADHGMAQSFNNSWGESNNLSSILTAADKRRSHHFGTWGAGKSRRTGKTRPPSGGALELEKLLRIKSEIQLNISKKVDKIKSKVSHSPALTKSNRALSRNNLVFVDPKILQTDSNPSPSTSQRQKQEAYLYGDNWSTDDEDDDDDGIDEVYGHGKVPSSSGSPSIIYSSSNTSSSNFPIEKSKSAGNALNFWKSIDSALTIGKRSAKESRPSCLPIQTTSTFAEPPPPPPKSSLLDEIESEYMQTEFCRKRQTPDSTPMSSQPPPPPPPPTSLPPSQSFPNLTDIQTAIDANEDDDEEEDDTHIESELLEEDALDAIDDEDDEMPSDALELQKKQTYQSRLPEPQPLYQIYMLHEQEKMLEVGASATTSGASSASGDTGMVEADSCCGSLVAENEDTLSSIIRRQSSSISTDSGRGCDSSSNLTSSTSMRRERLTAASIYGSQRSLWCELPEVKSAGLLNQLDDNSKKLQEAFFEVITSEASYLRSINFLISHFISAPEFLGTGMKPSIITAAERKHLFSNIINVRDCSERLLCDLENRLEDNLILSDVNDILCEHFEKYFDAYVKYCSNQVYQDRTLKRLKALNPQFLSCITRIEADRRCQGLDMRSFLMLPMQRITRYPLLVYAILERVPSKSDAIQRNAAKALLLANQVVHNCNEGARRMERTEQLLDIERRLIYKTADLKRIPLVTSGRYVVKNGQVLQIYERRAKGLLQTKQKTRNLYLFLFSDMLLIAKKRLNGTFICKDYAQRRFVVVEPVEAHSHKVPIGAIASLPSKSHLFVCILLQNAFGKQVELLLNVESESDRERWLTAMRPPTCSNPDEKIYAEWDCPQAVGVHHYSANQEDELELEPGDLINILRKMPDGWFYGERTRDGKGGWFPSSYVQQVLNDHVRANNYKQRLKVIEAAAVYRAQQQAAEKAAATSDLTTPTAPNHQNNGGGATPLIDRLRRLSNPRGFFVNL